MAVLADGRVVSGSKDKTLRVWNPTTGVCDVVLEGHTAVSVDVSMRVPVCVSVRVRTVEAEFGFAYFFLNSSCNSCVIELVLNLMPTLVALRSCMPSIYVMMT